MVTKYDVNLHGDIFARSFTERMPYMYLNNLTERKHAFNVWYKTMLFDVCGRIKQSGISKILVILVIILWGDWINWCVNLNFVVWLI